MDGVRWVLSFMKSICENFFLTTIDLRFQGYNYATQMRGMFPLNFTTLMQAAPR